MESWRAADIKCPYYKNCDDNRRLIICEGIMDRTTIKKDDAFRHHLPAY